MRNLAIFRKAPPNSTPYSFRKKEVRTRLRTVVPANAGTHTASSLNGISVVDISAKPLPGVMGPGSALAFARLSGTTVEGLSSSPSSST